MRLAIDAMGGDHAPEAIVHGSVKAIEAYKDLKIFLFGNESRIRSYLTNEERIQIIHTDEVITADDEPVRAVRRKKDASMVLAAQYVKEGKADACISAGNTGALMAAGLFYVGRMKGIERPALAPTLPTVDGKGFILLDAGANMDAKPEHLLQYAIIASVYAEKVRNIEEPKIGLLNVGTEQGKGNELTKKAFEMLKEAPIHFIGNVESRDLLNGVADVVVCDGFAGNLVLKSYEGAASTVFSMLKQELTSSLTSKLAASVLKPRLKGLKNKVDYSEYGGAGLFGLQSPVIKAHGSSNENAIFNTIRQARDIVEKNMYEKVSAAIQQLKIKEME
ncbi:phosphate acyltransferase PlsX [Bacillus taeanensis]|uniref:Phosphate acyltransferase n=1 Tax=Bacillus taeanensis TaxID=273032 RepID=A0A366XRX5_9BACI|nr:phosphate acyltransferase PlsX [Bacillus taeanensis]RBW67519.1 phosphate acyltransferase PlsX [Bacillus taeanensis]